MQSKKPFGRKLLWRAQSGDMDAFDPGDGTERPLSEERRRAIDESTESLPRQQREVFLLKDVAGLAHEQIAPVSIAVLTVVLAYGVANAEPQRDISQLDMRSANQSVTASGFEIQVLPALRKDNGTGILAGGQVVSFLNETFFLGGGGFGGTLVGRQGQNGGFGYGGFITGLETRAGDKLSFDIRVLIGGGGGTPAPGDQASGFILEPSLAINWAPLAKGLRLGITGGYLYLPGSTSLSGFIVGLKLEFKAFSLSWPE